MERLHEVGAAEVIDPSYLRHKLTDLREQVQKEYEFVVDQQILKGLIEGLKEEDIMKGILENYVVLKDELKSRIAILKKCLRREFDEVEEKAWTHFSPIKSRVKIKV